MRARTATRRRRLDPAAFRSAVDAIRTEAIAAQRAALRALREAQARPVHSPSH